MVYCNLISIEDGVLTYAIGGNPADLTGKLVVDINDKSYTLVEAPIKTKVYDRHIGAMLRRAQSDFDKGIFNVRLAYEI